MPEDKPRKNEKEFKSMSGPKFERIEKAMSSPPYEDVKPKPKKDNEK
jgi:hypothetical protein